MQIYANICPIYVQYRAIFRQNSPYICLICEATPTYNVICSHSMILSGNSAQKSGLYVVSMIVSPKIPGSCFLKWGNKIPRYPISDYLNFKVRYQDFGILFSEVADFRASSGLIYNFRHSDFGFLKIWNTNSDIQISEFWASESQIQILRSEGYTKPFRHKRAKTGFVKSNSSASSIGVLATEMAVFVSTPDLMVFTTALGSSARPIQEER